MPRTTTKTKTPVIETGFDLAAVPDEYRSQMQDLIPPTWVAERYISRDIAGKADFERFDLARETRHNIIMPGPTGAGKTTAARAYASARRLPFISVELDGGFDFASAIGGFQPVADWDGVGRQPVEYRLGEVSLGIKYGAVVSLEEPNAQHQRFMAAFFGTLDSRQSLYIKDAGLRIHRHEATTMFASYNPGYAGMVKLNEAFDNRFAMHLPWDYDPVVEEALVGAYSPRLLEMVRRIRLDPKIKTDVGTNVMEEFLTFATHDKGDLDFATYCFVNRFPDAERPAVENIVTAHQYQIAVDLGLAEDPDDELTADED